jgi:hypothetical protein
MRVMKDAGEQAETRGWQERGYLCWLHGIRVFMLARRVMAQTGITRAYNRFRAISDL